jgi:hypothetical protein
MSDRQPFRRDQARKVRQCNLAFSDLASIADISRFVVEISVSVGGRKLFLITSAALVELSAHKGRQEKSRNLLGRIWTKSRVPELVLVLHGQESVSPSVRHTEKPLDLMGCTTSVLLGAPRNTGFPDLLVCLVISPRISSATAVFVQVHGRDSPMTIGLPPVCPAAVYEHVRPNPNLLSHNLHQRAIPCNQ